MKSLLFLPQSVSPPFSVPFPPPRPESNSSPPQETSKLLDTFSLLSTSIQHKTPNRSRIIFPTHTRRCCFFRLLLRIGFFPVHLNYAPEVESSVSLQPRKIGAISFFSLPGCIFTQYIPQTALLPCVDLRFIRSTNKCKNPPPPPKNPNKRVIQDKDPYNKPARPPRSRPKKSNGHQSDPLESDGSSRRPG